MVGTIEALLEAAARLERAVGLAGRPRSDMARSFRLGRRVPAAVPLRGFGNGVYGRSPHPSPSFATQNTGSIVQQTASRAGSFLSVTSGVIAEAVAGLAGNIELRHHMAEQAGQRAKSFDLAAYGRRLMEALDETRTRSVS
jgi:hypothetical protein